MWHFDWSVFWAVLAALVIAEMFAKRMAVHLPWNVTLSLRDYQAIVGKLEAIELLLIDEGEV